MGRSVGGLRSLSGEASGGWDELERYAVDGKGGEAALGGGLGGEGGDGLCLGVGAAG